MLVALIVCAGLNPVALDTWPPPYHRAVAAALIDSPPGIPEPVPLDWEAVSAAVVREAVRRELMDPREATWLFRFRESWTSELEIIRARRLELEGAPLAADAVRFPDRGTANDLIRFNRAYKTHLEARLHYEQDRADVIREAMGETEQLYRAWDAVRDARCDFYYLTVRRQALKRLRDLVGPDAYYAGEMPPHAPTWRFRDAP